MMEHELSPVYPLLPCEVQVCLPWHGDVGQILLQDKNVPTHFLDARLTDAPEVLGPINKDAGDQVSQAWGISTGWPCLFPLLHRFPYNFSTEGPFAFGYRAPDSLYLGAGWLHFFSSFQVNQTLIFPFVHLPFLCLLFLPCEYREHWALVCYCLNPRACDSSLLLSCVKRILGGGWGGLGIWRRIIKETLFWNECQL